MNPTSEPLIFTCHRFAPQEDAGAGGRPPDAGDTAAREAPRDVRGGDGASRTERGSVSFKFRLLL